MSLLQRLHAVPDKMAAVKMRNCVRPHPLLFSSPEPPMVLSDLNYDKV